MAGCRVYRLLFACGMKAHFFTATGCTPHAIISTCAYTHRASLRAVHGQTAPATGINSAHAHTALPRGHLWFNKHNAAAQHGSPHQFACVCGGGGAKKIAGMSGGEMGRLMHALPIRQKRVRGGAPPQAAHRHACMHVYMCGWMDGWMGGHGWQPRARLLPAALAQSSGRS